MQLRYSGLLLAVALICEISGCTAQPKDRKSQPTNSTRDVASSGVKNNPIKQSFFESLSAEIQQNSKVEQAIRTALATNTDARVQAWHEFLSHWPSAKQNLGFAWQKEIQQFKGGVDATSLVENRYTLQIILDCDVSKDYNTVAFKMLRFSFEEVKAVQPQSGGGYDITFDSQNGKWFGLEEWEKLKQADWDFSKIGINVISNAPIPNIRQAFE